MAEQIAAPERDAGGRFVAARSPERVALAARIEHLAAAEERLDGTRAAVARANELWSAANAAERRAETALTEAREGEGRWVADRLRNGEAFDGSPVKVADAELIAARDAVAAARAAGEVLRVQIAEEERIAGNAQRAVRAAAVAVLAASPAVEAAVARLEAAQVELSAAVAVVSWLESSGVIETWSPIPGGLGDLAIRAREARRPNAAPPRPVTWEQALAALQIDADAPLPD